MDPYVFTEDDKVGLCFRTMLGHDLEGPPETAYHYTSVTAAMGIVAEKTVRFSDIVYANDPAEGTLVNYLCQKILSLDFDQMADGKRTFLRISSSISSKMQVIYWASQASFMMKKTLGTGTCFAYLS